MTSRACHWNKKIRVPCPYLGEQVPSEARDSGAMGVLGPRPSPGAPVPWEFLVPVPAQKNRVPSDSRGSRIPGSSLPLYQSRGSSATGVLGPCLQPPLPGQQHMDGGRSLSPQVSPKISRIAPGPGEGTEHPPRLSC